MLVTVTHRASPNAYTFKISPTLGGGASKCKRRACLIRGFVFSWLRLYTDNETENAREIGWFGLYSRSKLVLLLLARATLAGSASAPFIWFLPARNGIRTCRGNSAPTGLARCSAYRRLQKVPDPRFAENRKSLKYFLPACVSVVLRLK